MLEPGDNIDIWVVEKQLGSGGMGSVYRCHNRNAPRIKAAVKVLEGAIRKNKDAEARFIREAEILFQLDHPNIVKVRNVRTDHEPPYLEMEFVEGRALEDWLQEGKVPYEKAIQWMEQSAGAVAYLHAKGIRHRDIKPANLLVDKGGTLKVVDFGLAMESDNTRITQTGMAFGTVSYAPPEWVSPETLDPATWDIYALGVVFYEMLSGQMAFPASGQGSARQQAMQVIVGKQNHAPLDPGEGLPDPVRSLVMSACHSDPAKRPATARELFDRCRAITGSGATAPPVDLETLIPPDPTTETSLTSLDTWTEEESVSIAIAKRGLPVVAIAMLAFGFAIVGGIAAGVILLMMWGSSTRDVEVLALGVPDEETVKTRIGDITGKRDGVTTMFDAVPTGEVEIAWVLGSDCPIASCPGEECPAWCDTGTQTVEITEGDDRQSVKLKLDAPKPKPVVFETHDGVVGTLGKQPATASGGKLVFQAKPGRYRLVAEDGTCTPAHEGCWERKTCPEGCRSTTRDVVVPARGEFEAVALGLPSEAPAPAPTNPEPTPTPDPEPAPTPDPSPVTGPKPTPDPVPAPDPEPAPAPATASRPVSVKQFSRFLEAKPEYQPGGARSGSNYLTGWSGSTPPLNASGPVTGISPEAAATYCRWTGKKLASVKDPAPPNPRMEFRLDGGAYKLMDQNGKYPAKARVGSPFATFSCK